MKLDAQGLVVTEKRVGENDRLVTVLTRERGILRAFVRHPGRGAGGKLSATRLFTYSRFSVFEGRDRYIIDDAQPIEVFFDLRKDIGRLSLAQYFCELAVALAPQGEPAEGFLRLMLNALYFLGRGDRPEAPLKAAAEMRMMSLAGYQPDLVCCAGCKRYEAERMFFLPDEGRLFCPKCFRPEEHRGPASELGGGALTALRHTVYADFEKLFSFRVSREAAGQLSAAAERYVLETLGHGFGTLDFYHRIVSAAPGPKSGAGGAGKA